VLGHGLEGLLFEGNFKGWLNHDFGSAVPGWALLLLPACALVALLLVVQLVNPALRRASRHWSRATTALMDLVKFLASLGYTVLLALVLAVALNALGLDPRGLVVGTYVQRNALVVGFMMGFAIIPIIYTIAEDALSLVPEHLRSASLGCGATPWQTAVRIIIPTAMSGLFSAVMIGLGRAVGETMIVLMAAGNTPVLDWNIFNGFYTLSASIATELPDAVRDSTHYRTLFLAGLVLFLMTFVLNTAAEMVRLRFRKRAYQL
jgi:phosphate transport system permease protein